MVQHANNHNAQTCCHICLSPLISSTSEQEPLGDLHNDDELRKCLRYITSSFSHNTTSFPSVLCAACSSKAHALYKFGETSHCNLIALKQLVIEGELDTKAVQNLQRFCRICLEKFNNEHDLRETSDELSNWMRECTEIVLSDDLLEFPKRICCECYQKLKDFVDYRRKAKQSYERAEERSHEEAIDERPTAEEPTNAEPVDHYQEDVDHNEEVETDLEENTQMAEAVDDVDANNVADPFLATDCPSPNVSDISAAEVEKLEAETCDSSAAPVANEEQLMENENKPLVVETAEQMNRTTTMTISMHKKMTLIMKNCPMDNVIIL